VIASELDCSRARVITRLDGVERQNYPLSDMIFPPLELVSRISHDMSLLPGDVIACGTSLGVGSIKDGSSVEVTIDGIGSLLNTLDAAPVPKFNANLTLLFNESISWTAFAPPGMPASRGSNTCSPMRIASRTWSSACKANGLTQVLHNLPAGDWAKGERGIACLPDRVGEFQDGVGQAIEYALALQCPQLNCLAGIAPNGVDPERACATR
jgi:hypothetical protein